jgi:hypothetical protein
MRISTSSLPEDSLPVEVDELPDVADGFRLGISISASVDLGRLGLTEAHVRMALGEVARATLIAGGKLVYGGHLHPDGYTSFLVRECEKYQSRNRPFLGCVSWSEHRSLPLSEIFSLRSQIGLLGRYEFLDLEGRPMDPVVGRLEDPETIDGDSTVRALTGLRIRLTDLADARVLLGGKRSDYAGRMPGVVEEAILSIQAGKPVFFAGGFGGATADMVATLGIDPERWLNLESRSTDADQAELATAAAAADWDSTSNGLTAEQNQRLAVSYRASEIASLVVLGMSNLERHHE